MKGCKALMLGRFHKVPQVVLLLVLLILLLVLELSILTLCILQCIYEWGRWKGRRERKEGRGPDGKECISHNIGYTFHIVESAIKLGHEHTPLRLSRVEMRFA